MTNLVILVGRIARDPETRTTQSGSSITSISVVTDRPARNKEGKFRQGRRKCRVCTGKSGRCSQRRDGNRQYDCTNTNTAAF